MSKDKQVLKLHFDGYSQRAIARQLAMSRNSISKILKAWDTHNIAEDKLAIMEEKDVHRLLFPEEEAIPALVMPDFNYIHKELLKDGVTLKLLWNEYVAECREEKLPPYQYSQYCKLYQNHVNKNRLTMHVQHKPGARLMVDWAGTRIPIYDKCTGEEIPVYLFVATLPFSMYTYATACMSMKSEDWINAHISMYEYFGGVTKLLVPDNLKTGIISNKKHEDPILNRTYQELAEHYQTAILPARVLAPKDKAAVEGAVGNLTNYIIGRLRNYKFFNISSLNQTITQLLDEFNKNPFQKRDGSRSSVFFEEEQPFLKSLPQFPYEFATWKKATVKLNYHITVDYQNYSVPYEYVKKSVEVRITSHTLEVFYSGTRICSHKRLRGRRGQYSTIVDHMPRNHQLYSEWDKSRFLKWALDIGESTYTVVEKIFESYRVEEQAYKSCLSLLKLADKYTSKRLEAACTVALEKIPSPRYKNIRLVLESGNDIKNTGPIDNVNEGENAYALVRGAAYYGGNTNEK